jgi:biopolymer transport protein ExbB
MIVLALLSVAALAIVIYCFITFREVRLVPKEFSEHLIEKLRSGDLVTAKRLCHNRDNLIAKVAFAGFEKSKKDPHLMAEAMEHSSKELAMNLWKVLSYLSDIATISPLLGLLGTILGMIQAFNVIALQTAIVKPILLAGGVSKAMVTTAGGLIVAIPALGFYSYFRLKLQNILHVAEFYLTDVMRLMVADSKKTGEGK